MDIDEEPQPEAPQSPEFQPVPTTSGCQRHFPRHYQDFLPNSNIHIPHMPPKPIIRRDSTPAPPNNTEMSPSPSSDILWSLPSQMNSASTAFTSLIQVPIQMMFKISQITVMLQVYQRYLSPMHRSGGLASDVLSQILPKRLVTMFLCRSWTRPSFAWWIGFILGHLQCQLQIFSPSLMEYSLLQTSKYLI